jgi:multidrug efflux pump subunit AcrA (membrane-fusion protein)
VEAGQVLFHIDPREFQADLDQAAGNLAKARAALGKTQLDVGATPPLQGRQSQKPTTPCGPARRTRPPSTQRVRVEQAKLNRLTKVTH